MSALIIHLGVNFMRQITKTVYLYDELPTDGAKAKARDWYREGTVQDDFFAECVLDEAKSALKVLGYSVDNIYYSGFSSQGDGACFTGSFYASDYDGNGTNGVQKLLIDRPTDKELHRMCAELERILLAAPSLSASIEKVGRYQHEYTVRFSVDLGEEFPGTAAEVLVIEDSFIGVSRDFMRWIYKALETDYNYSVSDDAVSENIRCNEYEFDVDGQPAA
jgi:hypothetical protein